MQAMKIQTPARKRSKKPDSPLVTLELVKAAIEELQSAHADKFYRPDADHWYPKMQHLSVEQLVHGLDVLSRMDRDKPPSLRVVMDACESRNSGLRCQGHGCARGADGFCRWHGEHQSVERQRLISERLHDPVTARQIRFINHLHVITPFEWITLQTMDSALILKAWPDEIVETWKMQKRNRPEKGESRDSYVERLFVAVDGVVKA